MSAEGHARGKVILLGEHVVVYGAPAIAAGIDRGAKATASRASGDSTLSLGGKIIVADRSSDEELPRAFAALLDQAPLAEPVAVVADADLPPGGGLGCSAALGVAIGRAVTLLSGEADDAQALARAVSWEGVFHGNPSGIDTTAAASGGCFQFTRAGGATPLALGVDLVLCIGWSGSGSSTSEMVASVARLFERKPDLKTRSIEGISALVTNAALALEAGDLSGLGSLMDLNQMILSGLMLSTEPIERLCSLARKAGALGAKLTGAGGGGSVVALVPSRRVGAVDVSDEAAERAAERIVNAWRSEGFTGFVTRVIAERPRLTLTSNERGSA